MKIEKEEIIMESGRSFKCHFPSLKDCFYWHYHSEIELVYIKGLTGIRHVGQHISSFTDSDLILIGPNIPHLNFDYGLTTEYDQIVVQLKENFLNEVWMNIPEFFQIKELFERAKYGIAFKGATKEKVASKLSRINDLNGFEQLIEMLEIFQVLGCSNEYEVLNTIDTSVNLFLNDKLRMGTIYNYIHENYSEEVDVNIIAQKLNLSTSAFCRYFKKQTRMTFTDFVNQYRINVAKTMLLKGMNVSETCYHVGFQSLSYFNKLFKGNVGKGPLEFKKEQLRIPVI